MKKGKSRNKRKKTRSRLLWIAIAVIGIAAVISAVCVAGMLETKENAWRTPEELLVEYMYHIPKKEYEEMYAMADMKSLLQSNDKWLRHRIRAVYWKQWKKTKTKYRKLKELGMNEDFIQWHANMRQGIWNCSNNRLVQFALSNEKLREWGYPTFTEFYLKRCEN